MLRNPMRIVGSTLLLVIAANAQDPTKPSTASLLNQIKGVEIPAPDRTKLNDETYVKQYIEARNAAFTKQAELIGELYKTDPACKELKGLLPTRWMVLANDEKRQTEVNSELSAILKGDKQSELFPEAAFFKARLTIHREPENSKAALAAIEEFMTAVPKDERGPSLLYQATESLPDLSVDQKKAIFDRIRKDFPNSRAAAEIKVASRKLDGIGKPFELTFNEAIGGKSITMADLKGKVVVVDFWATWCGPCVSEMPKMKTLYAEYKPKGVEFIGVSLDSPEAEGGLKQLKEFVAENGITWPQYYQGNGWESEFSVSWGINSIPAVFVVDQKGNLFSTDARGKLEAMIPELLKKGGEASEE
jgi:thiol-disulfide isomerase/thioredoxin